VDGFHFSQNPFLEKKNGKDYAIELTDASGDTTH